MGLWAHHLAIDLFGTEFAPETPLDHVIAFGITGIALGLMLYGAYAGIRDISRWRRRSASPVA